MKNNLSIIVITSAISVSGCASIDFEGKGIAYYDTVPHLFVSTPCKGPITATVVALPGKKRTMKFNSGYGSSELSATFSNGMLVSVGQKTDSKIPETITALAAAAAFSENDACTPKASLYPFTTDKDGNISINKSKEILVQ
ncbi:MAG TPA: hypothetical protein ENJ08_18260 [Gammaproteobacteria bacterium]|nr:hypothetical protein [Gammaproteobacteria bacterium]